MKNAAKIVVMGLLVSYFLAVAVVQLQPPRTAVINVGIPVAYAGNATGFISSYASNTVRTMLPAVDEDGNGVITELVVEAFPGSGRVLADINQLLFWADTQYSIQTAKRVTGNVTGIDIGKYDLIYTVVTNASLIEGGSAGAALTVATIAAVTNKQLRPDVVITGTIQPNGLIGPVGGVLEKANATKQAGARTFLVPAGQSVVVTRGFVQRCDQRVFAKFCKAAWETAETNITDIVNIEVREVGGIYDAMRYMVV